MWKVNLTEPIRQSLSICLFDLLLDRIGRVFPPFAIQFAELSLAKTRWGKIEVCANHRANEQFVAREKKTKK